MPERQRIWSATITNNSGATYYVEELHNYELDVDESIDLLDEETLGSLAYTDIKDVDRLVGQMTDSKLYQDIQSGDISYVKEWIQQ